MPSWQLKVLGELALTRGETRLGPERKTAGLLCYLALEGPTPRGKLAGLLWPDSPERTARNNLAQVLRRLRAASGAELVTGGDVLALSPEVEVDAVQARLAGFSGRDHEALERAGELLTVYDYSDCAEFDDWRLAESERLLELRGKRLRERLERLERARAWAEALELARALAALEPLSEAAQQRLMRLAYRAGDRAAALRAYERWRALLADGLGVAPLPETEALARLIERGAPLPGDGAPREAPAPLSALRPPALVGREAAWARLEAAWAAGQVIFLSGEPGAGKTRLALEFAAAQGRSLHLDSRPGDAELPYASQARAMRRALGALPAPALPGWARRELSRLLPELLGDELPPPMASEEDKLRFFEALSTLVRGLGGQVETLVMDDLQFADPASAEAGRYLLSRLASEGGPRLIACFRRGELAQEDARAVAGLVESGAAALVELEPLPPEAVRQLVAAFEVPALLPLGAPIARYTGGNPLFVLETVKHLLETGALERGWPEHFPPPGRVGPLIRRRLARLSPDALRLAQLAAVAQEAFSPELAAALQEKPALELAPAWQELARARIFEGGRFAHDLLLEATLETLPAPLRAFLHRRCAEELERAGAQPALVARHYLAAGEAARAAPLLLRAAEAAKASFRLAEAAADYGRAAAGFEAARQRAEAFRARAEEVILLVYHGMAPDQEARVAALEAEARSPAERTQASFARALLCYAAGQGEACERAAREGLAQAERSGDRALQAKLRSYLGEAFYLQGRVGDALTAFEETAEICEGLGERADLASALSNVAVMLDLQDRYAEAERHYRRADALSQALGDLGGRITVLNNYGFSLREGARARAALEPLEQARELLRETSGAVEDARRNLGQLGETLAQLGRYGEALALLGEAKTLSQAHGLPHGFLLASLAKLYVMLGAFGHAEAALEQALAQDANRGRVRGVLALTRARLQLWRGEPPEAAFAEARALLERPDSPAACAKLQLFRALAVPPAAGLELAREALELGERRGLADLRIAARTRLAQLSLVLGRPDEATAHAAEASGLLVAYDPLDLAPAEVWLAEHQARSALGACGKGALERALAWLARAAAATPAEHRPGLLGRNPVNRALLEAAKRAGLALPAPNAA